MLFSSLKNYLLCACVFSYASAIPTSDLRFDQHTLTSPNGYGSPRKSTSFLSRISSCLIERVWPHYKSSSVQKSCKSQNTCHHKHHSRYNEDTVLRFKIKTEKEALAFAEAVDTLYLDVWEASKTWADVRISKKVLPSFLSLLPSSLQHSHTPIITQLSQTVFDSFPDTDSHEYGRHRPGKDVPHDLFFRDYRPLSVIYPWLRHIAWMFPNHTQLFTIGTSYEGRDIPAISIGSNPDSDSNSSDQEPRQTIVITAGSHAREWISISTAAFLIRSLVPTFDSSSSSAIDKLLSHYDIIIIPVLNPDGYEYTWTTDRLWRKNRQETALPFCRGIDLDRSFPFSWDGDLQMDNPCSEAYAGEHPLQAVEAQRLHSWAKNVTSTDSQNNRVLAAFIDLHSYSQEILYPYSYSCDRRPRNLEDLEEIATGLAKAFRLSSGHRYTVDSACEDSIGVKTTVTSLASKQQPPIGLQKSSSSSVRTKIEESGGSVLDFFYQDLGVKYAFQIKLRDTGSYGFLLPRSNIVPTGMEAFNALLGLGKWMLGNRGIEGYTGLTSDEIWGEDDGFAGDDGVSSDFDDDDEVNDDDITTNEGDDESTWYVVRRRR